MKGFVFTEFLRFVEVSHNLEMVDEMITNSNLPSKGIYSAFNSYDFNELVSMLSFVCAKTKVPVEVLLEEFGKFVFPYLIGKHSYIIKEYKNPLDLIAGIETHIHMQVKILYEDAELPTFRLVEKHKNKVVVIYKSKRGLTYFAIGLMKQSFHHFKVKGKVWIDSDYDDDDGVKFIIQTNN
jgi:hypothetical protein